MIKKYYVPDTVLDAADLKQRCGNSVCFMSGGTKVNRGLISDDLEGIISLEDLPLKTTRFDINGIQMGALVTLQGIAGNKDFPEYLRTAARNSFPRNIRNISTIGGNVGATNGNTPILACLVALNAILGTVIPSRTPIEEYLKADAQELITYVILPPLKGVCVTKRVARSSGALPVICVATRLALRKGKVREVMIAVTGVAPKVIRLKSVEDDLLNGTLKIQPGMEKKMNLDIEPESDLTGSGEYKKYITGVTVADCLMACQQRRRS